ncbi:alcohol dehydrogenase-2 [Coleophoma cylindrospora]|uniref:Alcohol dehydrogenase-2 n=1 Tax=Coleophoma cylindrospora TaxID=1849047 RepID=A0A3D8RFH8_9HELO|nr:alcohol dehydrogenase-2 [Coleophoma cylindrospora]
MEIPKKCKAGVVINEGPMFHVEVQMVDVPEPAPGQLLLRLNATGICMSDIHYMSNDVEIPPMSTFGVRCPGHEGAGVVVKLGDGVVGWKVGDRAGMKPNWDTCGMCEQCWEGKDNYCSNAISSGLMVNGSYQQYVTTSARYTTRIPEGVSDFVAAPIMCSASTMHNSLVTSGLKAGQFAVFVGGGGGVGIQGVQLAKAMGMRPIVIDSSDAKKELSLKMGAEAFIDFRLVKSVAEEVVKVADGVGAHGVFVTAPQGYKDAISYTGTPAKNTTVLGADPLVFNTRNLCIMGTLIGSMRDTDLALDYARRGLLHQICEVRPLSRIAESVEQLRKGEVPGRIVIDFNQE